MNDNERYIKDRATVMSIIKFALIIALTGVVCYFATKLVAVMVPFLIGFLLAKTAHAIGKPLTKKHKGKPGFRKKRQRVETVIFVIIIILLFVFAIVCTLSLISQLTKAFDAVSDIAYGMRTDSLDTTLLEKLAVENGGFLSRSTLDSIYDYIGDLQNSILAALPETLAKLVSSIWNILSNLPYAIFVVICIILSGYYFINDGPAVLRFYMKNVPNKDFRTSSLSLINDLSTTLFRALGGYTLLLVITAVEAWIAFTIAGVDYALILAIITAVLDFMPVLGISATMIPVMIYCAFHNNVQAIVILIIAMAIMTVIRRFIEPPIVGKSLHLHPLMMLIAMALGVYIWNAIGFLLGPVVFIIVMDVFKVFGLDKKLMNYFSQVLARFMRKPEEEEKAS